MTNLTILSKQLFVTKDIHGAGQPFLLYSHQVVSDSFATPWTIARQPPLSVGFPRQEYWSELSFPLPGDLPDPGKQTHISVIGRQILYHETSREAPQIKYTQKQNDLALEND